MGDQHEGPVGVRNAFGPAEGGVEEGPQAHLVEQGVDRENRPPGRGLEDLGLPRGLGLVAEVSAEQSLELGQDLGEQIVAAQSGDDALREPAVLALGFDGAEGFGDVAAGRRDLDGFGVHAEKYHDLKARSQGKDSEI